MVRSVLDTLRLNFRLTQWPITVLDPLEEADLIVTRFLDQRATITADRHLTHEGKVNATRDAGAAAVAAVAAWHTPRLAGLDADIGVHRTRLLPTGPPPDARAVDFMLRTMQTYSVEEMAVFYGSATDHERLVMEAASASVGRVPTKTANGLVWQPLLNPERVNESVMARAAVKDPAGVAALTELMELRSMHITVAGIATADIKAETAA